MRSLLVLCFTLSVFGADQPIATYTRFCASCGILGADTILSQSGQFVVHGATGSVYPPVRPNDAPPLIELEPQLVAVTAERSRRAFVEEFAFPNAFRDKIHIALLGRARPEQPIGLVSHLHSDGFQYQVRLPIYLESRRLIKALVQALLQEYCNRGVKRSAELPSWLVEGMTYQLLSSVVPSPVLNRKPLTVERTGYDRLGGTRLYFQTNSPLTIQDLSFANLTALSEPERIRYEASSHLLVHELLRLRGGPALMARFFQELPHALNWQTAFYSAYRQYFHTALDLEKWWMLASLEASNQQARQVWATQPSLERLDAILRIPTEIRVSTNAIPEKRDASIQEIITSTEFGAHKELLLQKLQQIFFLSVNLSAAVAPIADAYEQAIESYLQKRALNEYQPSLKSDPGQRAESLAKATVKQLDDLDRAREDVRAGRTPKLPQPPRKSGRQVLITRGNSQN